MISERMKNMAAKNSEIRAMFEEGNRLAALYGRENVYDFSLGNPNVPAPKEVNEAVVDVVKEVETTTLHGYMPNSGYPDVRRAVAEDLNRKNNFCYTENDIIMTVGAAGGLNCVLQTLLNPGDEVLVFAPYFLEYGNYVTNWGGVLKAIPADETTFQPSAEKLAAAITDKTKAVILNNPNNPTGVIYSKEALLKIADVLTKKSSELGHAVYMIADEPYRELAYDGAEVPFLPALYDNVVTVYSWSKSLSMPGDRIGYIAVSPKAEDAEMIFTAASISNRIIGFVNAPSLMQKVVAKCLDCKTDVSAYDKNRKLLYKLLTDCGFTCIMPQGAFYLWMKTPCEDREFAKMAKNHNILLVSGSSFACPGYVRIAYCVSYEQIERSAQAFRDLAKECNL